jgi:excisionase family DNA binding protein
MAQKFVSLEEAATQIGISKDRLNELREDGKVRAYRDGASWKFRADDVTKLVAEGLPPAGSDLSLAKDDAPSDAAASGELSELSLGSDLKLDDIELGSDVRLDLGEDESLSGPAASDVSLDDLDEPTVPVESAGEEEVLSLEDEDVDDLSDSILLSENELGESTDRPPSTIIGKAEMAADLDLELAASDSDAAAMSDVRLAEPSTSNVFVPSAGDSGLDMEPPSLSDNFGGLEELEIDLEAESSRILSPEDVNKAQQAAQAKSKQEKPAEMSDLELALSDSSPGGVLDTSASGSNLGIAGLSALELEGDSDSDEDVLGDGSDITLSSESSGINIISPSDSGLALDDVSLSMGSGSPIASGLDLGPTSDVGLEPLEVAAEEGGDEPFALTPFGEDAIEEEEDSSQVIPLDEVSEDEELLGASPRGAAADALGDDFGAIGAGVMPVSEPAVDVPFSMANIAGLSFCLLLLLMCGMMVFDLLRNMWSWGGTYTLNSSLMDVLSPLLG